LLSQGDNWFIFHLLSATDLAAAKRANAHFSDDLLSSLLNEPIEGNGIFWSSATKRPIPVPFRALLFQNLVKPFDPKYDKPEAETYARALRRRFESRVADMVASTTVNSALPTTGGQATGSPARPPVLDGDLEAEGTTDVLEIICRRAIAGFRQDGETGRQLKLRGVTWRGVLEALKRHIPNDADERDRLAHSLVPRAMTEIYGEQGVGWKIESRAKKIGTGTTTWIIALSS
jgi:hypothetical protein